MEHQPLREHSTLGSFDQPQTGASVRFMTDDVKIDYIIKGLRPLAAPTETLTLWDEKENPNDGDVEALARSLYVFGQRTPIVHGPTHIIKGNTTLKAARLLASGWRPSDIPDGTKVQGDGAWDHLATVYAEDDPLTAGAYAIADNRIRDLARTDEEALVDLLESLRDSSNAALLPATTYDTDDIEALLDFAGDFTPFLGEIESGKYAGGKLQPSDADYEFETNDTVPGEVGGSGVPAFDDPAGFEPGEPGNVASGSEYQPAPPPPQAERAAVYLRFGSLRAKCDPEAFERFVNQAAAAEGLENAGLHALKLMGFADHEIENA